MKENDETIDSAPEPHPQPTVKTRSTEDEQTKRFDAPINYELLRVHAQGGLGRVWVAKDTNLHREVAIKELLPNRILQPESRRRFMLEAQVTGQLTHPHIVPVYQLGENSKTGTPYYAMRLIQGETLRKAIANARKSPGGMSIVEYRRLLAAFVSVCNALAYAHTRGVVHRDLKTENVVLGEFGEVLVIDWGLAKVAGQEDDPVPPVEVSKTVSSAETQQGTIMGTPIYMAPEQAAGDIDHINSRTDVFGLGAILFEILTGVPPHKSAPPRELVRVVAAEPCRTAREVDAGVPAALDAICRKATMFEPDDRYPLATDLAHDIELWLAGEPVSAYREPWKTRAWRWARRHRTLVTTSAALLIASVIGLSLNTWLVGKEQQKTAQALVRAQKNFDSARAAVDQMLHEVAEIDLQDVPKMERPRRELFQKALAFYQQFASDSPNDPELRVDVAEAHEKVGDIAGKLGEWSSACNAYGQSIQILSSLPKTFPRREKLEPAFRLARVHDSLGEALRMTGDLAGAEIEFRLASEQISSSEISETHRLLEQARVGYNLGLLMLENGRLAESETSLQGSILSSKRLLELGSTDAKHRQGLARAFINLGIVKRGLEQFEESESYYGQAIQLLTKMLSDSPDDQEYRHELATARISLGNLLLKQNADLLLKQKREQNADLLLKQKREHDADLLLKQKREHDAEAALRDSLRELELLVEEFPHTPTYLEELANATNGLGKLLRDTKQDKEAERVFRNADALFDKLLVVEPNIPEHESLAALTKNNLAVLLHEKGELQQSRQLYEAARILQEKALSAAPQHQQRRSSLKSHMLRLADVYIDLKLHREAHDIARELQSFDWIHSDDVCRAAKLIARTIPLVQTDESLSTNQQNAEAAMRRIESLDLLEKAVANGFSDRKELDDESYAALQSESRFQELLQTLQKSTD